MNYSILNIADRCKREFTNSKSAAQLAVAYRYYRLFYKQMILKGIGKEVVDTIDKKLIKLYKKHKERLWW